MEEGRKEGPLLVRSNCLLAWLTGRHFHSTTGHHYVQSTFNLANNLDLVKVLACIVSTKSYDLAKKTNSYSASQAAKMESRLWRFSLIVAA